MVQLQQLPRDIILDILTRLPFEHVIQCKEVCKTWENILHHVKRDQNVNLLIAGKSSGIMQLCYLDYDEKTIFTLGYTRVDYEVQYNHYHPMVGSHKGLVCFRISHDNVNDPIQICNPFTRESVRLPEFAVPKDAKNGFMVSGFGYLYSTNEYKIVRIYYNVSELSVGQVQVYTLGDKSGWRNKGTTDHYIPCKSNGILYDGALHWLKDSGLEIVAFDLEDETFRSFPVQPCFQLKDTDYYPKLMLLGGYLSIVLPRPAYGTYIWSLKESKNGSGCKHWSKEFIIRSRHLNPPLYHPIALTEDNKILSRLGPKLQNTLCLLDPKTATVEELVYDDAKIFKELQAIPYMKSDVSLEELEADLLVVNSVLSSANEIA